MASPLLPGPAVSASVGSAARSAMTWNLASMAFGQIAIAAIFLLLAGRLEPSTFGIFALAAVLTDFFYSVASSSAVDAILQRQDLSRKTLSTIVWTALVACSLIALVIVVGSGAYAAIVGDMHVATVLEVLSLSVLIVPFVIGPSAILRQRLDFKAIALLNMIASFVGGLAALAVAYSPWVEWALVVQRFVTSGMLVVLMTVRTRFIPAMEFDRATSGQLVRATGKVFAGQGIAGVTPRAVDLLMGIFFGVAAVGLLRVASRLTEMVLAALVNPIGQMWVVVLTRAKASASQRRAIFLQLTNLIALIALPGFVGLALIANDFIRIALKPGYAPAADMLIVMCAMGAFTPLTNSRNAILTALNKLDLLVWFSVLDFVATVTGLILMRPFGPTMMLLGAGLSPVILVAVAVPYVLKQMNTTKAELTLKLMPPYVAVAAMSLGVIALAPALSSFAPLNALLLKIVAGAALYLGVLAVFFRGAVMDSIKSLSANA